MRGKIKNAAIEAWPHFYEENKLVVLLNYFQRPCGNIFAIVFQPKIINTGR